MTFTTILLKSHLRHVVYEDDRVLHAMRRRDELLNEHGLSDSALLGGDLAAEWVSIDASASHHSKR